MGGLTELGNRDRRRYVGTVSGMMSDVVVACVTDMTNAINTANARDVIVTEAM